MDLQPILPVSAHPGLPGLIASVFNWKAIEPPVDSKVSFGWVDTGREIFSIPHFNHAAGPLWMDDEVFETIELIGKHFSKKVGVRILLNKLVTNPPKVVSILNLEERGNSSFHFTGNLGRKIRAAHRKGIRIECNEKSALKEFYSLYEKRLHQLGSANLNYKFFEFLFNSYPDNSLKADVFIHIARFKGRCVGGAFSLRYGLWFENVWFATDISYSSLYTAYALHAEIINDAINSGALIYSFGRSTPGSGVHRFKKQWGTTDYPLVVYRLPPERLSLQDYPWLSRVWKRIPLPIARTFNPFIAKWMY